MALDILDGNSVARTLKTSTSGSDLVPHHNVDAVSGIVSAAQSGAWSVSITGTVPGISPGTGASNLGKAEDSAHTTGDVGVMVLAVRNDSGSVLAGTTGDYIPFTTDATGALRVVGGGGGSQYAEDAAHANADLGTMALSVRRDTASTTTGADGDYSPLLTDANGRLHCNAVIADGKLGTSNPGVVIGAVQQSGNWNAHAETGFVYADGVRLQVKTRFVSVAAFPGTVVTAVASKKIRVLSVSTGHSAAGSTSLTDGSGGTVLYTVNQAANTTNVNNPGRGYVCETTAGNGLFVTATAGTSNVWVQYVEV